jgi:hypothetical protein
MWENEDKNDEGYDSEENRRKLDSLPIYQKALEIYDLTKRISDTFDKLESIQPYKDIMIEDSVVIPAKIANAEAVTNYILKMENAVLLKIHARSLYTQTTLLSFVANVDDEYLQLLRNEIDELQVLFKKWIAGFETDSTKEGDGWGLFLPDTE